jgi:TDG/mug DNA glycosylase family protein
VIGPGLKVLFCGINPGLYSAATGFHFARPGNRFWPALHAAGFTPRLFHPSENERLLELGYGLTNLVNRGTAAAAELSPAELVAGGKILAAKVRRFRPCAVAFVGLGAYRRAFSRPQATLGRQAEPLEGAEVWVLPSPSGLNANYQLPELVKLFSVLHRLTTEFNMATKLDKTLKREIDIEGNPFMLSISPEGLKLVPKGKRNGLEIAWKDLVSGEAALATALNASLKV